jgi:hypothetical protein
LGARIEAETAVLRDEFVERLDATLLAHSPKKYKELVAEIDATKASVRAALKEQSGTTSALLDKLAERVDAVDGKRRHDRNTWHREREEIVPKVTAAVAEMLDKMDLKFVRQAKQIEALEEAVRELSSQPPGR